MNEKNLVYPDWVQQYRTKGKTVKKKGDKYYLYSRTSKRVPGKKYPQPVDTYIGIITHQKELLMPRVKFYRWMSVMYMNMVFQKHYRSYVLLSGK